jgi:hypothetical protein
MVVVARREIVIPLLLPRNRLCLLLLLLFLKQSLPDWSGCILLQAELLLLGPAPVV